MSTERGDSRAGFSKQQYGAVEIHQATTSYKRSETCTPNLLKYHER